jgi:hypothetical protein
LKAEKEDHEEEKHVPLTCKFCGYEANRQEFGDHEENCNKKPKPCSFCEQMIEFDNFLKHVNFCGSRTRKCEFCQRNVVMRNQIHHEQDECAKFLREEYENKEQEKIQEMEEDEKRKRKVEDLQFKRRQMKEEKEKEKIRIDERKKPMSKPSGISGATRSSKPSESGPKRSLPDYYGKPKPYGVSTRLREKKVEAKPVSSYQPRTRLQKKVDTKEEEKEIRRRPAPRAAPKVIPKPAPVADKYPSYIQDVEMKDEFDMNEIPAELLNQIYSEDLDQVEVEKFQNNSPVRVHESVGERLIGGDDMDDDYRRPPRMEPRRVSPPPRQEPMIPSQPRPEETDNESLQKAIAASMADNESRQFPMRKFILYNSVEFLII